MAEGVFYMHPRLSVQWKLVIAVVGVSFLCLGGLMFLNRYQAAGVLLANSRSLVRDASGLEASRYNLLAENAATLVRSIFIRVGAELDFMNSRVGNPDVQRVATFVSASLAGAESYVYNLGVILKPGIFRHGKGESAGFFNSDDYAFIAFKREGGDIVPVAPLPVRDIESSDWWKDVFTTGASVMREPFTALHKAGADGQGQYHAVSRFISPVQYDNSIVGVVVAEVCLTEYQRRIRLEEDASGTNREERQAMLVSHAGICVGVPEGLDLSDLVARSPDPRVLPRLMTGRHPELMRAIAESRSYAQTLELGKRRRRVYVASHPIQRRDMKEFWSAVVIQPEDAVQSGLQGAFLRQYYETFGMLLVSVALGFLVSRVMGRTLTSTEVWHRTILDRVPMPLGIVDDRCRWIYVNPSIAQTLGLSREEMIGKDCGLHMPERSHRFIQASNRPDAAEVETLELAARAGRVFNVSSCLLLDTEGKYLGRLIIGVDVTDARSVVRTLDLASSIAESLDAKSGSILASARGLSESAMEESSAIEEITATTQQIGAASADYAVSARKSHEQAEFANVASGKGAKEAISAVGAMSGVRESGQKITSIIKLIDDIAFQTNLLALNAAVEAARAGRHGKGFAVVAGEVRNLAGRSAKAARETASMIEEMTLRIGDAADSIAKLGATLAEIKANAEWLRDNSDSVARLADLQSESVRQVHVSLEQISKSVSSTITVSRETATVAESIFQQSAALRKLTHEKAAPRRPAGRGGARPAARPAPAEGETP